MFTVTAEQVGDTTGYSVTTSMNYTILPALTAVSLAINPSSAQTTGTPITLTATVKGGVRVQYCFSAGYQDAAGWHCSSSIIYGPLATYTWTPGAAHAYTVQVTARETTDYVNIFTASQAILIAPPVSAVSLTVNPANYA